MLWHVSWALAQISCHLHVQIVISITINIWLYITTGQRPTLQKYGHNLLMTWSNHADRQRQTWIKTPPPHSSKVIILYHWYYYCYCCFYYCCYYNYKCFYILLSRRQTIDKVGQLFGRGFRRQSADEIVEPWHVSLVTSRQWRQKWQMIRTPTLLFWFIFSQQNIKSGPYGSAVGYSTGKQFAGRTFHQPIVFEN